MTTILSYIRRLVLCFSLPRINCKTNLLAFVLCYRCSSQIHLLRFLVSDLCFVHNAIFPSMCWFCLLSVQGHLFFSIHIFIFFCTSFCFTMNWHAVSIGRSIQQNVERSHDDDATAGLLFCLLCIPYALHDDRHVSTDTFNDQSFFLSQW